jgi:hypothetical protein
MKLTATEQKIVNIIAKGIVILLAVFVYTARVLFMLLYRLKRWLYKISIVILIVWSAYTTLHTVAYAPKAEAVLNGFNSVKNPTTEHEKIINYINETFEEDAPVAFKLLTECGENKALNPNAVNTAGNSPVGSRDIGVFQINEYWQKTQGKFLFNWRINIEAAHQLFEENGKSFKLWTGGRRCGI